MTPNSQYSVPRPPDSQVILSTYAKGGALGIDGTVEYSVLKNIASTECLNEFSMNAYSGFGVPQFRALSLFKVPTHLRAIVVCSAAALFSQHLSAQSNALTAQVSIDTTQIKRTIPDTLYGTNLQYPFEGMGLWNPTLNTFDYGVWSNAFAARPTLWRFPGGVYSDSYSLDRWCRAAIVTPHEAHLDGRPFWTITTSGLTRP